MIIVVLACGAGSCSCTVLFSYREDNIERPDHPSQDVRDILHLREGGVVVSEQENDSFVIKPAESLLDYKGYLKGRARPAEVDRVRETARTYVGRKAGKRRDRP